MAGGVFRLTGAYDPATLTVAMCREACAGLNDLTINTAGITEGRLCLCGSVAAAMDLELDPDACDLPCYDAVLECGGAKGRFSVYESSSSKLQRMQFTATLAVIYCKKELREQSLVVATTLIPVVNQQLINYLA